MSNVKYILSFLKIYSKKLQIIKIMVLIIVNIWLLFIFWKIIVLDGLNITNNNIALTKMQTILGPLLQILGLDVLSPNTLKMIIISIIVLTSNLAVLYFSQMIAFILLGITAKYSYKAYYNYINKDTLNYYGFEKIVNLTEQEKVAILNDFIMENNINDPNVIAFLQNKINNLICSDKNELILNINNNWLDYKQQILSKIILYQKEQIEVINKKVSTSLWESIDYWTLLKIGGGIIIIGGIIIGGYYYFNNNSNNDAILTSQDISKNVLDANTQISGFDHNNIININNHIKDISNELNINKKNIEELNINLCEINKYKEDIINNNNKTIEKIISEQQNFLEEGQNVIEISKLNNENMGQMIDVIKDINDNIITITNNIDTIKIKTKELDVKINGGTQELKIIENDIPINKIVEYKPLLNEVKEMSDTIGVLTDTLDATLSYLGIDSIRLSQKGVNMLIEISKKNKEEISENVSDHDDI